MSAPHQPCLLLQTPRSRDRQGYIVLTSKQPPSWENILELFQSCDAGKPSLHCIFSFRRVRHHERNETTRQGKETLLLLHPQIIYWDEGRKIGLQQSLEDFLSIEIESWAQQDSIGKGLDGPMVLQDSRMDDFLERLDLPPVLEGNGTPAFIIYSPEEEPLGKRLRINRRVLFALGISAALAAIWSAEKTSTRHETEDNPPQAFSPGDGEEFTQEQKWDEEWNRFIQVFDFNNVETFDAEEAARLFSNFCAEQRNYLSGDENIEKIRTLVAELINEGRVIEYMPFKDITIKDMTARDLDEDNLENEITKLSHHINNHRRSNEFD